MRTEDNKKLVVEFIRRFETGDIDHAYELLSDDFHWEVMGDSPIAGRHDKASIRQISQGVVDVFPEPPKWQPVDVIAEGDKSRSRRSAAGTPTTASSTATATTYSSPSATERCWRSKSSWTPATSAT